MQNNYSSIIEFGFKIVANLGKLAAPHLKL
jgi:hypothetical protein